MKPASHSPSILFIVLSTLGLLHATVVPPALAQSPDPFTVRIQVDAAHALGELKPIWRFFGADERNYTTMKDGRKLLGELGKLRPKQVYFRCHNLLCTGDGTPALKWGSTDAYQEDSAGRGAVVLRPEPLWQLSPGA